MAGLASPVATRSLALLDKTGGNPRRPPYPKMEVSPIFHPAVNLLLLEYTKETPMGKRLSKIYTRTGDEGNQETARASQKPRRE